MEKKMNDVVFLITGASSEIGCGLIKQLIEETDSNIEFTGKIIAHARSGPENLIKLIKDNPPWKNHLEIITADLSNISDIENMMHLIKEKYGYPTHIVHLAASKLELKRTSDFEWGAMGIDFKIQVESIGIILKNFLPLMSKSGKRCKVIMMLSSVTLGNPPKYMTEYTTVKYALLGLFRSFAAEYSGKSINFNAVSPSMVETQFLSNLPEKFIELTAEAHPDNKNATVDDIVPAICFLLSEEANHINGINLPITGGS
jgi:3-oxoacyl-[acyl-carrier protein] reductase